MIKLLLMSVADSLGLRCDACSVSSPTRLLPVFINRDVL